jgi:glycosyltransferase involved in cell wall biosynthesis
MFVARILAWVWNRLQKAAVFMAVSLNDFLEWLFASRNPAVVFVRESIRRNRLLLASARMVIHHVRSLPTLHQRIRERFKPFRERSLQSIMAARMVGGRVTLDELEQLSHQGRWRRVLVAVDGPEREQVSIILRAFRAKITHLNATQKKADLRRFGLAVVASTDESLAAKLAAAGARKILRVGSGKRSSNVVTPRIAASHDREAANKHQRVREKIAAGERLRIVFLNDVGFQYGAGGALKRQMASLLLDGHEVSLVAWQPGVLRQPPAVTGVAGFEGWRGVHDMHQAHKGISADMHRVAKERIAAFQPDVVITGNLHGAGWPLELLPDLRSLGAAVVAFMHDTYFVTGRCAQPMGCQMFRTGCDATCPTPNEYPRLAPEKIAASWQQRDRIFAQENSVPLIGNSRWTANIAYQRFQDRAVGGFVHLALDHELFAPMSKITVRRLLRVPEGKVVVALGAVDVHDQWKGGPVFHALHQALLKRNDISVILFGGASRAMRSRRSFGLVTDERMMPFILNAADIFVSTGRAESFGQSLLEASACAAPVVAFDVGAVSEVVVHDETGILVREQKVEGLLDAIDRLVADPDERERLGRAGRARVENGFTLKHQADAWVDCLNRIC